MTHVILRHLYTEDAYNIFAELLMKIESIAALIVILYFGRFWFFSSAFPSVLIV